MRSSSAFVLNVAMTLNEDIAMIFCSDVSEMSAKIRMLDMNFSLVVMSSACCIAVGEIFVSFVVRKAKQASIFRRLNLHFNLIEI